MELARVLCLDHFLLTVGEPVFGELESLCGVFKRCFRKATVRPGASYEAIYLEAWDGSYLEFIKNADEEPNVFALAVCSAIPNLTDVNQLPMLYPCLRWLSEAIRDSENNAWYTCHRLAPTENVKSPTVVFWAIEYQNLSRHRVYQNRLVPPSKAQYSISGFTSIQVKVPQSCINSVEYLGQWLPGTRETGRRRARLVIPDASRQAVEVLLEVEQGLGEARLAGVSMALIKDIRKYPKRLTRIAFGREGSSLVMTSSY
jgi:hypothetical protein